MNYSNLKSAILLVCIHQGCTFNAIHFGKLVIRTTILALPSLHVLPKVVVTQAVCLPIFQRKEMETYPQVQQMMAVKS